MSRDADVIVIGGGLAGCLIALRLTDARPDLRVVIIEGSASIAGNHTWSFFGTDISSDQHAWLGRLVGHRWPGYEVRFAEHAIRLSTAYLSMTSTRLRAEVEQRFPERILRDATAISATADHVVLEGGRTLRAPCVIDARGGRPVPGLALGFQKFLGLEVRLAAPHGLDVPIVMDATVAQSDGYRFVYTLPLDPQRLLIEDTYYSDGGELPEQVLHQRIARYALAKGWQIAEIIRAEQGVLPVILAGDPSGLVSKPDSPPRVGLAALLVHPTTGYSLPDAVRVADLLTARLAQRGALSSADARETIDGYGRTIWRRRGYYRFLNRMLFKAAEPSERHRILARFYGLDQALIERFYAARIQPQDKLRVFMHMLMKPPIPISSALACLPEASAFKTP
ncbi:Lycopene cyclase [Bradyrhizobium sp. ORS 278]|uniref:lycopene beta-cyclase CrtY n=1 Tax=Bradyrhizobium sp. (strain ORS 278) TaxID=114615 RepID=UPI00000B89B9|nr:lycopene beta-cyclase CrtY [Bradyrhizobium sp. ORS 278]AAF78200.1 lycopene cyclase [Bradyrhizobium sp. ORS 278]CAL80120.1 Lycopene cyclase [Bradyrhizobium sp. ORS 278]